MEHRSALRVVAPWSLFKDCRHEVRAIPLPSLHILSCRAHLMWPNSPEFRAGNPFSLNSGEFSHLSHVKRNACCVFCGLSVNISPHLLRKQPDQFLSSSLNDSITLIGEL